MQTPGGDLQRQWAVLDHTKEQRHPNGSVSESLTWAELPTILNDTMNLEVD